MTRSDAEQRMSVRASGRRSICDALLGAALLAAAGCASGRHDLPSPRIRDEAALQTEAKTTHSAEPFYQMALLRAGQGQTEPALAALKASLDRDPAYAPSLTLLAKLLHDSGRSAEGVHYFESKKLDTLPDAVRLNVALLYADVGNTLKARKLLQGTAQGTCADAANANLAYLDLVDDQNATAAQRLEKNLGAYADNPEIVNNVALARLRAGDVETGARLLRELTEKHPEFAPAQLNLALVLRNYLFDEDGATRAQAHFDAIGAPHIGDPAWHDFLEPGHEDAAPPLPAVPEASAAPKPSSTKGQR